MIILITTAKQLGSNSKWGYEEKKNLKYSSNKDH